MDKKICFACKQNLSLEDYCDSNMKYQLKSDLGKVRVCKVCNFKKAVENLKLVNYNFEDKKFEVITFDSKKDVIEWLVNNNKV